MTLPIHLNAQMQPPTGRTAETRVVSFPIRFGIWGRLETPATMTEQDWERMLSSINALKVGFVAVPDAGGIGTDLARARNVIRDLLWQHAYPTGPEFSGDPVGQNREYLEYQRARGRTTGGLSANEDAFRFLSLPDPAPAEAFREEDEMDGGDGRVQGEK